MLGHGAVTGRVIAFRFGHTNLPIVSGAIGPRTAAGTFAAAGVMIAKRQQRAAVALQRPNLPGGRAQTAGMIAHLMLFFGF